MCEQSPALSSTLRSVPVTPVHSCLFPSQSPSFCASGAASCCFHPRPSSLSLSTAYGCLSMCQPLEDIFLINIHSPPSQPPAPTPHPPTAYCVCLNANQFLRKFHWPTYGFRATAPSSKLPYLPPLVLSSFPLLLFPLHLSFPIITPHFLSLSVLFFLPRSTISFLFLSCSYPPSLSPFHFPSSSHPSSFPLLHFLLFHFFVSLLQLLFSPVPHSLFNCCLYFHPVLLLLFSPFFLFPSIPAPLFSIYQPF